MAKPAKPSEQEYKENMILKKIKLHNWKNFQNCEVNLEERCFIIGANASGKSNFIDALRFLRDITKGCEINKI
jgi:predicted ATPase